MRTTLLLLAVAPLATALPSCDAETEAHCVSEDADLSPEGITACLSALSDKSADCTTYLAMMAACDTDLKPDAVCGAAKMDGEAVPCLVQRVKPEQLSEACRAALPDTSLKGLAKFWADGKRQVPSQRLEPGCFAAAARRQRTPMLRCGR